MSTEIEVKEKTTVQLAPPALWKVIFLNDDKTPMELVIELLTGIFKHSESKAKEITLEIHETGSSIVQGNFANLPDIERTWAIYQDFIELAGKDHSYTWLPSTVDYHNYLLELLHDPARKHLIKAHLYCRHMGDLYGGQILAKRVPGQGRFYKFKDPERLKEQIRAELTDDLGDEARVAFEWAIKIMRDLNNEPSVEHAD